MRRPLNLASQPFRNESLPNLLFGVATLALLALSLQHALLLRDVLPSRSSSLGGEVTGLEKELEELRAEARRLRRPAPPAARVAEWRVVKDLVDRRTFSWNALLARLEGALPPGARLASISPSVGGARVKLEVTAVARTRDDAFELVGALRAGGFPDALLLSQAPSKEGDQLVLSMTYAAAARGAGAPR